ncbi:2-polyprenyl-6-methoxyphenol hydroxylase [Microbacterium sp. SYP-A9085]|uniref:FAD-dependent monooxygenase n=1 Tax=Microbacterium sp. SYP-A9085 TaxID=2664454 RepID=UPI00129B2C29|nr:FAD-dependent monooxygenase [Microbacterium sp. SYP-A9085]MRH28018.1 2-polyprenyl-6-methoxyphenol hydroxylase [Microbacterium sp. SYP-A9085]
MKYKDVVIAGAGPVGLTLAIVLGQLGVKVLLADKRPSLGKLPKMERCNARTMENFRRLGLADRIRAAGLDNDMPMDVFICVESIARTPALVCHEYPSVNELKSSYRDVRDGTTAAEPYQLISQYTLEPLLRDVAESIPGVDVRFESEIVDFEQDDDTVLTTIRSADGSEHVVTSSYLVGCDGGGSTVRQKLGFELEGESRLEMRQALFRSKNLLDRIPIGIGRHYHIADSTNSFMIVQDDKEHFSFHATVDSDEEMAPLFEKIVGFPFDYETLYVGRWQQRLMLADHYRSGRVFLAGDSAHLVIPTGGLGMNTGHADAVDLGWKLAAVIRGWGGQGLLDSYEPERRQIAERNIAASRKATVARNKWRRLWRPEIVDSTPEGERIRHDLKAVAEVEHRWSNDLYGIELGYVYSDSPITSYDPDLERGEDDLSFVYEPSIEPGARLPHVWLADGRPIQDDLGWEFTLIATGGIDDAEAAGFVDAFARLGVPFRVYRPESEDAVAAYGTGLLLVRPDLHIVWRGASAPEDALAVARLVTGQRVAV